MLRAQPPAACACMGLPSPMSALGGSFCSPPTHIASTTANLIFSPLKPSALPLAGGGIPQGGPGSYLWSTWASSTVLRPRCCSGDERGEVGAFLRHLLTFWRLALPAPTCSSGTKGAGVGVPQGWGRGCSGTGVQGVGGVSPTRFRPGQKGAEHPGALPPRSVTHSAISAASCPGSPRCCWERSRSQPPCPRTLPPARCHSTPCLQEPSLAAAPRGSTWPRRPRALPLNGLTLLLAVVLVLRQLLLDEGDGLHAQAHRVAGTALPLGPAACGVTGLVRLRGGMVAGMGT